MAANSTVIASSSADLIAMLWTQYIPEPEVWAVDGEFQKLVYAAVK